MYFNHLGRFYLQGLGLHGLHHGFAHETQEKMAAEFVRRLHLQEAAQKLLEGLEVDVLQRNMQ